VKAPICAALLADRSLTGPTSYQVFLADASDIAFRVQVQVVL